jgi:hypothetical protein
VTEIADFLLRPSPVWVKVIGLSSTCRQVHRVRAYDDPHGHGHMDHGLTGNLKWLTSAATCRHSSVIDSIHSRQGFNGFRDIVERLGPAPVPEGADPSVLDVVGDPRLCVPNTHPTGSCNESVLVNKAAEDPIAA